MRRSRVLNAFPPKRPSPLHITAAAVAQLHRAPARGTLTKSSPCPGRNQSLSPHGLWGHWQALEGLCGVLVWGRGWEEGWGWGWEEQWEWGWGRLSPRAAVLRVTLLSPPRSGEGRAAAAGTCHSAAPQSAPCSTRLAALIPLIPKNNNGSQQQSRPQEPAVPERAATERKNPHRVGEVGQGGTGGAPLASARCGGAAWGARAVLEGELQLAVPPPRQHLAARRWPPATSWARRLPPRRCRAPVMAGAASAAGPAGTARQGPAGSGQKGIISARPAAGREVGAQRADGEPQASSWGAHGVGRGSRNGKTPAGC